MIGTTLAHYRVNAALGLGGLGLSAGEDLVGRGCGLGGFAAGAAVVAAVAVLRSGRSHDPTPQYNLSMITWHVGSFFDG